MDTRSYTMEILGFGHYQVFTNRGTTLGTVELLKTERWLAIAPDGRHLGSYRRVREACEALTTHHHAYLPV